ncbi:MAG: hypothetical protein JWP50_1707 [Phenylobacterium sp.]|nr:hypothetical protein [Phenylobacterium sp.]
MNTSRKLLLSAAIAVAATSMASAAFAQASDSKSIVASVTVIKPIALTAGSALKFGRLVVDAGATATVLVPADGTTAATTTNATQVGGTGAGAGVGSFSIAGEADQSVVIDLVPAGFTAPVSLGSLTHNAGATPALRSDGTLPFNVGGTLTVGSTATAGVYSGTVTATVHYQ